MQACAHDDETYLAHHDCQGEGGRIHAIVIGVSKYTTPRRLRSKPFDSLPGAARAAYRFARYLKEEFHEPERRSLATLRLMLSPLDRERDDLTLQAGPATGREVGNALQDWADDCNTDDQNLAILYVAGHGVALDKGVSTLFLADALEEGNKYRGAINLSLVQDRMAGCAAKDNVFVYDCCALKPDDVPAVEGGEGGVFITKFASGGRKRQSSLLVSAARVGTKTFALDDQGTLLSRSLLGAYTDHMGEDALLRTAGNILRKRFGITAYQLRQDMNPKLRDVLRSIKHADDKYEGNVTGDLAPQDHIAIPEPTPKFGVVLRQVQTGRTPPIKVWFVDANNNEREPRDNVLDGQEVQLPAGEYEVYVQSAEGRRRYPIELAKSQELEVPLESGRL